MPVEPKFFTVYQTTNTLNGMIYVGMHITSNPNDEYLGSGRYLNRAIKKHGKDIFKKEILHLFNTFEEMAEAEANIVNEEFVGRKDIYNLTLGGQGSWFYATQCLKNIPKEELRLLKQKAACAANKNGAQQKGSLRHKELFENDSEYRKKWLIKVKENSPGNSFEGKTHTEETKNKMRKAKAGKYDGQKNPNYGNSWFHHLELKQNKLLTKEQQKDYEANGWIKGRRVCFVV